MKLTIVDPASWSLAYDMPLAAALARAEGVTSVRVACTPSAHGVDVVAPPGVEVDECFYRRGYGLGVLPRRVGRAIQHPLDLSKLIRRIRDDGTDAVLVQWLPGSKIDVRAWTSLAREMPVLFTAHNAQEREGAIAPKKLRDFTAVIAHSAGGAQRLREGGVSTVWHMQIGAFDQYATMTEPAAPLVDAADDELLVAMPGLIRPYKGMDVLLQAWDVVAQAVPRARLVIAGRPMGVDIPTIRPDRCDIVPRFLSEEELGWLLRRADVCCLPYRAIDMSGVASSAIACSTPLVLSDVGGFDEYVGRGGVLVPPGNAGQLADTLIALLNDDERRAALAYEASAAAADYFNWDRISACYVQQLRTLIDEAHA